MRDSWFRRGKPQTYAQAWLFAAMIAAFLGAWFSFFGIINDWQGPWPQFAILSPAISLVFSGLRFTYDVRRRRVSSRNG